MNAVIEIANMLLGGLAAGMVLFIVSVGLSVTMGLMASSTSPTAGLP